jgi:hypothetical protein
MSELQGDALTRVDAQEVENEETSHCGLIIVARDTFRSWSFLYEYLSLTEEIYRCHTDVEVGEDNIADPVDGHCRVVRIVISDRCLGEGVKKWTALRIPMRAVTWNEGSLPAR